MRRSSLAVAIALSLAVRAEAAPVATQLVASVQAYFTNIVGRLEQVATNAPTAETFRGVLKPAVASLDGFYDASLLSADWIILQVGDPSHFLGVGYDLKKVKALDPFRGRMAEAPGPQVSEPAAGGWMSPRLISVRVPVRVEGNVVRIVSLMVRTDAFLKAVGLADCRAFAITCGEVKAERKGKLTPAATRVEVPLPATRWVIEYE